jgi:ATP-dependent Clp protease ATP-binding subunit ClpC
VVVLAQDEARSLGHAFIAPEHIFLGLIREPEGAASHVLEALGVGYEAARSDAIARHGQGDEFPAGQIPFTPAAKKSLELSLREALSLGHNYVGTEHLLLGLSRLEPSVITSYGLTRDEVHDQVVALLSRGPLEPSPYEGALDSYGGDEPWAERIEALRREGWEIMRIIVQRRRLRS